MKVKSNQLPKTRPGEVLVVIGATLFLMIWSIFYLVFSLINLFVVMWIVIIPAMFIATWNVVECYIDDRKSHSQFKSS